MGLTRVKLPKIAALAAALGALLCAGEKRPPAGEVSDESVEVKGTVIEPDRLQELFGSDFNRMFVVVETTIAPKGGKPLDVRLDDFLLRSEQTGEHSGPLSASQIAGQESLVVKRQEQQKKGGGGFSGGFGGIMMGGGGIGRPTVQDNTKVEVKESDTKDPMLGVLKRKILAEKTVSGPETGLLFFPLDKEKTKNLVLVYSTPQGKLRMKFK